MIDIVLLVGRILLIALLYLFLFALMRTGICLVRGQREKRATWSIAVEKGPREIRGVTLPVTGPIVIGRSPGADIVINDTFVSGRHARVGLMGADLVIEDLQSTNGTLVNGKEVVGVTVLAPSDRIEIGEVVLKAMLR